MEAPPLLQAAVPQVMASQADVPPAVPQVMASQTGVPQVMASQVPVSQTFSLSSTGQMVGGNVQDSLSQPTSMVSLLFFLLLSYLFCLHQFSTWLVHFV